MLWATQDTSLSDNFISYSALWFTDWRLLCEGVAWQMANICWKGLICAHIWLLCSCYCSKLALIIAVLLHHIEMVSWVFSFSLSWLLVCQTSALLSYFQSSSPWFLSPLLFLLLVNNILSPLISPGPNPLLFIFSLLNSRPLYSFCGLLQQKMPPQHLMSCLIILLQCFI